MRAADVRARGAHMWRNETQGEFAAKSARSATVQAGTPAAIAAGMVPISRRKQVAGIVGAMAFGYALSWLLTPGASTGPVTSFEPTFAGESVAPVIVSPGAAPARPRPLENHEKELSKPLQKERPEPI